MQKFYLRLVEHDVMIEDPDGQSFIDLDAAVVDAIRQIRSMVALEIAQNGEADLSRAIEIVSQHGAARRVSFCEAISVSI